MWHKQWGEALQGRFLQQLTFGLNLNMQWLLGKERKGERNDSEDSLCINGLTRKREALGIAAA